MYPLWFGPPVAERNRKNRVVSMYSPPREALVYRCFPCTAFFFFKSCFPDTP